MNGFRGHDGCHLRPHVRPLDQHYRGPYKVISRGPESFVIEVGVMQDKFHINRLKPYFFKERDAQPSPPPRRGRPSSSSTSTTTPTFPVVGGVPDRPAHPRARAPAYLRKDIGSNCFEESSTSFKPKIKSLSSVGNIFIMYVRNFLYSFILNYGKSPVSFRGDVELPASVGGIWRLFLTCIGILCTSRSQTIKQSKR